MKIIAIIGSPHAQRGNTARLTRLVLQGAQEQGASIEEIYLRGETVLPCLGCDYCHKKGECVQKDSFEQIRGSLLEADGLVLASPNYIFHVSAQMKAFMDRCASIIHCLGFQGKYGASVVTSGGGDEEPVAGYMNHFMMTTGIQSVGSVWATMAMISGDQFPPQIATSAVELGKRLASAAQNKQRFPEILKKMEAFEARMRALVIYRKDEWPYEYEYWKKHRGLA
ncbi:MAG: flavodoxin family protein [Syntrophobacteraceae bacterium]